ncbi:hypothetical protein E8E14_010620 [Neopestalotiopsis sp. 37M]|nr:hypothetical protein E8E14_010620 [Neopestalotiopsis sp. 37M]
MASQSNASCATSSQGRDGQLTQGENPSESVRDYVSETQTTPVEHLSAGNGKPTSLREKVQKTQKAIEKWEKEWKNASSGK